MIDEEIVKRILSEKPKRKDYTRRKIDLVDIDKIFTLIGPRRAGKTFFLFQIMDDLISKGVNEDQILYINFEDERLSDVTKEDLQKIIDIFNTRHQDIKSDKTYFMFDEIQNVPEWPKFIRRLYDKEDCKIFITGSSAKLLSKEIATELRGRTWSYYVYPFSFDEFLSYKKITDVKKAIYDKRRYELMKHFKEYLLIGGFPEIISLDESQRNTILQNYYEIVLFRDVIERNKIKNTDLVRDVFRQLIGKFAREVSVNSIYNTFKSQNRAISKDFIYPLFNYIEDSMYCFFVPMHTDSAKKKMVNPKKAYFIDTGLIRSLISKEEETGWLYENLVAVELLRRGFELSYHKGKKECDFIAYDKLKKEKIPIQVTLNTHDKREIEGLDEAMDRINAKEGIILTESEEKTIMRENKKIKIMPVWIWLLEK